MRAGQRVLVGLLLVAAAGRAAADAYVSQVRYVYDRLGRQAGAVVLIQTDHSAWRFTLSRQFLNMPVARQTAALDNQFNLGQDRDVVSGVLDSIQQARQANQQQQIQQQQQQIMDQINQQMQQQQMQEQIRQQQQQIMDQINQQQQQQQIQQQIQDAINRANQPTFVPPPAPYIPPPAPHFP